MPEKVFKTKEAQNFYDRFGKLQDSQAFYEDKATNNLILQSNFEEARKVFEYGCGTGRFAAKLLQNHLPAGASYRGIDLSPVMVKLARQRLKAWENRAIVSQGAEPCEVPLEATLVNGLIYDRFVSTYVLDLLSPQDITRVLEKAGKLLSPSGKLCLTSLGFGTGFLPRLISNLWFNLRELLPSLTGGCRPIRLLDFLDSSKWEIEYYARVTAFGITSEVVVAKPIKN